MGDGKKRRDFTKQDIKVLCRNTRDIDKTMNLLYIELLFYIYLYHYSYLNKKRK